MAKKLRDTKSKKGPVPFIDPGKLDKDQQAYIRKTVEQNRGKSADELKRELFETARAQKQAGQFDPAGLENFMRSVGPMLSPEQYAQMETLVRSLKKGD